jgi:hypothetical protein
MDSPYPRPVYRKLRAYAFDPSLSLNIDTTSFNVITYLLPWEEVTPGPTCEYLEVIDIDPTIPVENGKYGVFYRPIDLNDPFLLASDGLAPSDANPLFHQQMVYAVAMKTIKNFERALGRKIIWRENESGPQKESYVERLRIYPHALREPNAYYSPVKKALLFGYFKSTPSEKNLHMPGSWVFTCLSHDIIAHETTHAILDGLNFYYNEPTNPDVHAFHEAFADIVALFQHFTVPEVLYNQINKTKGDLESQNLLGQLAQEFGAAIGGYSSLRDAIGKYDNQTKEWKRIEPNVGDYENEMDPHKRGSILVAAVFDSFLLIYKSRVADLIRIATNGTGILPEGNLHPDLINRLCIEAAKTASNILNICIRAIDYCPPVDLTFGEYLRAIITADCDLMPDDPNNYRLAFIESFKRRGIYPVGIKTLSVESLRYPILDNKKDILLAKVSEIIMDYSKKVKFKNSRREIYYTTRSFITGGEGEKGLHEKIFQLLKNNMKEFENLTGMMFHQGHIRFGINNEEIILNENEKAFIPKFKIDNLREISRVSPTGSKVNQIKFSLIQTARITFDENNNILPIQDKSSEYMRFRGGVTWIFDMDTETIKYGISKPLIDQNNHLNLNKRVFDQFSFMSDTENNGMSEFEKAFGISRFSDFQEPFALLHNH